MMPYFSLVEMRKELVSCTESTNFRNILLHMLIYVAIQYIIYVQYMYKI